MLADLPPPPPDEAPSPLQESPLTRYARSVEGGYAGVGRACGISRGDVHNYAHGLRGFSVDRALLLSAVTGLSLDELFEPFKRRREAPPDTS